MTFGKTTPALRACFSIWRMGRPTATVHCVQGPLGVGDARWHSDHTHSMADTPGEPLAPFPAPFAT